MRKKAKFLFPVVIGMLVSCQSSMVGNGGDDDFARTASGLEYKVHKQGTRKNIALNDAVVFHMRLKAGDEVLRDTWKEGVALNMVLDEIPFEGSFEEGLTYLAEGDSASFHVDADSLYEKSFGAPKPSGLENNKVVFDVKVDKVVSEDELERDKEVEELRVKLENEEQINTYLRNNKIFEVEKDLSGLYMVRKKKGNGEKVEEGQRVAVHYIGKLVNGQVFDNSYEKEEPMVFTLGKGEVISGWDIGIAKLEQGEKAILVVPSYLGYGAEGAGTTIPPDSPLVFEVELVAVQE
ncbi:FKBP-type peptidyl-prolyl cis-trans isomerase [Cytophagaceae bacterium ABcell3]|nr:FKBP-type peptidyl-prolyl cis-trans isomerase [Cytophagaceae bacterium ABcell3]